MYLLGTTDKQQLTLIQQRQEGKPLVNKCQDLLDLWCRTTANPKWEHVINVLKKMTLHGLATQLQTALGQEQQGKVACYMNG